MEPAKDDPLDKFGYQLLVDCLSLTNKKHKDLDPCHYWLASILALETEGYETFDGFAYWMKTFMSVCSAKSEHFTSDSLLICLKQGIESGLIIVKLNDAKQIVNIMTSNRYPYRPKTTITEFYMHLVLRNANIYQKKYDNRRIISEKNKDLLTDSGGKLKVKSRSACTNQQATWEEFMAFDNKRIANVLTSFDNAQMLALNIQQLILNPKKEIQELTTRFNHINQWLVELILTAEGGYHNRIFLKIIDLIAKCLDLHNFNTAIALLSVFSKHYIMRLNHLFTKEVKDKLAPYEKLFACQKSYKTYREKYNKTKQPKIPQISVLSADITFFKEGNKLIVDSQVNWDAVCVLKKIVESVLCFNRIRGYEYHNRNRKFTDIHVEQFILRCLDPKYFTSNEAVLDKLSNGIKPYTGELADQFEQKQQEERDRICKEWKKSKLRRKQLRESGNSHVFIIAPESSNTKGIRRQLTPRRNLRSNPLSKSTGNLPTIIKCLETVGGAGHETSFYVIPPENRKPKKKKKRKKKKKKKKSKQRNRSHSQQQVPALKLNNPNKSDSPISPRSPKVDVLNWDNKEVLRWLRGIGMKDHTEQFKMHRITGMDLVQLDKDDLKEMKVSTIHDRKTFFSNIKYLALESCPN